MRFAVTGWLVICAEAALWGQTPIRFDTPSPLPDGEVGVPYEMQIRFSGGKPFLGTGIVQYTYTSNFAVPGVGMQNGTTTTHAQIGGTPTVAGTYSFTVNVNDGLGTSASMPYSVTIYPRLEIVTPSALPDAEEGAPYSFQLVWQGGIQPYTSFQCVSSIGPLGFACDQQGLITGRTSSISGRTDTYSCAIELTIQSRSRNVQRRCFDLTIRPGLAITDTQFGTGSMGQPYSHQLTAVRGKTPYTWSATGTIPAGLTFSSSGRLSGTPTQTGTFQITARVTDANGTVVGRTLSLTITAAAFAISNNSLPAGTVGQGYSQQLTASNAQGAVTWAGSGFPPGITMNSSGLISGTPTQAGTFTVFLNATDAAGRIATKTLVFSVASPQPAELALVGVGGNLTAGRVGSLYTGTILARGGTQPYTFTFTNLPPGLTASPDGGITGTPTTPGTYTINVTVTDATGQRAAGQYAIFIAEGTPPPPSKVSIVTPSPLSSAVVGTGAYTRQLEAKDGTPPYTWRVSAGQPPLGFTLSAGGLYFGVAIVGGDYSFSVTVTDSKGDTDTRSYRHTIVTLPRVTNTLIKGRVNTPYSAEVVIQGGSAPYRTRMVGGTLPRGVTYDGTSRMFTGTPTESGTFRPRLEITDANNLAVVAELTLEVEAASAPIKLTIIPRSIRVTNVRLAAICGSPPVIPVMVTGLGTPTLGTATLAGSIADVISAPKTFEIPGTIPLQLQSNKPFNIGVNTGNLVLTGPGINEVVPIEVIQPMEVPSSNEWRFLSCDPFNNPFFGPRKPPYLLDRIPFLLDHTLILQPPSSSGDIQAKVLHRGSPVDWFHVQTKQEGDSFAVLLRLDRSKGTLPGDYTCFLVLTPANGQPLEIAFFLHVAAPSEGAITYINDYKIDFGDLQYINDRYELDVDITGPERVQVSGVEVSPITKLLPPAITYELESGYVTTRMNSSFELTPLLPPLLTAKVEFLAPGQAEIGTARVTFDSAAVNFPSLDRDQVLLDLARIEASIGVRNALRRTFRFVASTYNSGDCSAFTVTPQQGVIPANGSSQLIVGFNPACPKGDYSGGLTIIELDPPPEGEGQPPVQCILQYSEGEIVRTEQEKSSAGERPAEGCRASRLLVLTARPSPLASVTAGLPIPLRAWVYDDCGEPVRSAEVTLSPGNGDADVQLGYTGNGRYSGVWTPVRPGDGLVRTVVVARAGDLLGANSVYVSVKPNAQASLVEEGSFVNGASLEGGRSLAPGEFISIIGSNLAARTEKAASLPLPVSLSGVSLTVNGKPAPISSIGPERITAVLPFGLPVNRRHEVYLRRDGFEIGPLRLLFTAAQPAVFTRDESGKGQGTILDTQYRHFDATNPGHAGDSFIIYASGLGEVDPPVPAGARTPLAPLSRVKSPMLVTIGGVEVKDIVFAGLAPGDLSGIYQLVGVIPPGVPAGDATPVVVTVNAMSSPPVTMAIRP